ncbi:50S ribosomal protein L32 [bacterium]|nr:50S ribosomal protein L32 [bacterium]
MAEPKKRTSKSRKNKRRVNHAELPVNTKKCSKCGKQTLPHKICGSCGTYNK